MICVVNGVRGLLFGGALLAVASAALTAGHVPFASVSAVVASLVCLFVALKGLRRVADSESLALAAQLQDSRGQLKQVVENLPVGLFMLRDAQFSFSNWAWDEQMDRSPGQGLTESFQRALAAEERTDVLAKLAAFEQREEPFHMRFQLRDKFGVSRHIESNGVPVYGADGNFLHLLGFNVDVSSAEKAAHDLDAQNQALEKAYVTLEDNLEAMVASLVKAIEAKDPYTAGHSERVMEYSVRLGEAYGLSKEDMNVLRMGTLIHDIGKIGVPDSVLTKPDKLTDEEFDIIKRHPVTGFNLIRDIPYFKACAPIVRWHHERLNGTGYPDGLRGDEIPLLVQISTIADMFDAMTSNRAYRRSLGVEVAIAELRKDADRNVVNGELVELWASLLKADGLLHDDLYEEELPRAA